ncbi:hypothetical protein ACP4OV_000558 [Aristida adscensionis]
MGSGASRLLTACACSRPAPGPADDGPCLDDALGHSFCYAGSAAAAAAADSSSSFRRAISGAALSANSSVPVPIYHSSSAAGGAPAHYSSAFHTSSSFSSAPLQLSNLSSGPLFLSGPIDRAGQLSGPLDQAVPFSGPLPAKPSKPAPSSSARGLSRRFRKPSFGSLRRSVSEKNRPCVVPLRREDGVQWAHGRAGEDRVHVVVSEDQRWLFVGIYDGFNGPEAPDFLVANLYRFLLRELRGIFYEEAEADSRRLWQFLADGDDDDNELDFSGSGRFALSLARLKERRHSMWAHAAAVGDDGGSREWGARKLTAAPAVRDHRAVLGALTRALATTEAAYLDMTSQSMGSHPELAVTGACLLVALVRDDDVYVMNLGDSRAIVAQRREDDEDYVIRTMRVEEFGVGSEAETRQSGYAAIGLDALQLSTDHSTGIEEEVQRIKREHPDDDQCIVNDRVKGRLKVTRAFGAGYLKQAKLNEGLLEIFRNDYIGDAPYISCTPSLCHHKLSARDQFLVLSSDGLYQYLSNEEVVLHVENFMERFPDGDPAQSLIEELLSRAAKKAGMDFYELLDIPQGDRRKYHDDVTVMVISLEGRIWKSSGTYV